MTIFNKQQDRVLEDILCETRETNGVLVAILDILERFINNRPTAIHISFEGVSMPVTLVVGQTVVATATETDAAGKVIPFIPADISWVSSDDNIATVVVHPDGSATYTAVAAGTATATVGDSSNRLTAQDTITVEPKVDVATAIAITFGTPA
jgi:hypothetical protein